MSGISLFMAVWAMWAASALWLAFPSQELQPQSADPPQIRDVQIRGNSGVSASAILNRISTRPGDALNRIAISADVRAIYALEAFDDIYVEEEGNAQDGVILVFHVKEKPRIQNVTYPGLSSIPLSEVLAAFNEQKTSLTQGSYYDETRVRRAVAIIKSLLAEKGRQKAQVDVTTAAVAPNNVIVTMSVSEGPQIKVESIEFTGNASLTDAALKRAMKLIKESNWLTPFTGKDAYHEGKLAFDIDNVRALYAEKGYARVNVREPDVNERQMEVHRTLPFIAPRFPWGIPLPFWTKKVDRAFIAVQVEENDRYFLGDLNISGNSAFPSVVLQDVLGLRTGDQYNETLLRTGFERLKQLYGARGFINFTPRPQTRFDDDRRLVHLDIAIDEDQPYVTSRIFFSGNTTTRDSVLRREFEMNEGELFNSVLLDAGMSRLNQLGYFEEIREQDATIRRHPTEPKLDVTLKVREKERNTIGFDGGMSAMGSFVGFRYETSNFLGLGETLKLDLRAGTRQTNAVLSFSEPYLTGRPLSVGFSLFHSNYKYDEARELRSAGLEGALDGLGFESRRNYEQMRTGFSVSGSYPIGGSHRLGLTYQLDNSSIHGVNAATRDYFAAIGGSADFAAGRTRKIIPSFVYSSLNHPDYPARGQSFRRRSNTAAEHSAGLRTSSAPLSITGSSGRTPRGVT